MQKPIQHPEDLTAFKKSLRSLRRRMLSATIDYREFQRTISRCSLPTCRGTCCYDGASVDHETGAEIQKLANKRRSAFQAMGLNLPDQVVEPSEWNGVRGTKTAVRAFPFRSLVSDYPAHFNETACVFLLDDGRCGLQILSEQEGRHPWYYKPFTCWLQPIKISDSAIRLYDENTDPNKLPNDPNKLPNYDGFVVRTHCGRTDQCGAPAAQVLKEELKFLGALLDRDLLSEVNKLQVEKGSQADGDDKLGDGP
jgi:hypothetical protein